MKPLPSVSVASRIVAGRLVRDISQETLAMHLGVSRRMVSRWETGRASVPAAREREIFGFFAELGEVA